MQLLLKRGRCSVVQNKDNDLLNSILDEYDPSKRSSADNNIEPSPAEADASVTAGDTAFETETHEAESAPADAEKTQMMPNNGVPADQPMIRKRPADGNRPNGTKKKKKKKKKKRNRLPGVLILTTFIFAVSICLSLVIIAYGKDMLGIGKSENTQLIEIQESDTAESIANLLEERGIIKSPKFFMLFARLSGKDKKFIVGEHFIRPNMAYETIITELTSTENAQKESVEVTITEGMTLIDAAMKLSEEGVCNTDEFLFNFNAGGLGFDFENKINSVAGLKFYRMEGYAFPDTYYFYKNMEPDQVCQKIYLNFSNKMGSSVEINGRTYEDRYKRMEELGLTLDQLMTFASIVQAEAATPEAMTMVASVFWNRLNHKDVFPKLESDPTRLYAENVIKPNMAVYDEDMINAYNTYTGTGLPPGAIGNPGIAAIDAVLNAVESEYYFFYANTRTGETLFAKTNEEHEANIQKVKEENAAADKAEKEANKKNNG